MQSSLLLDQLRSQIEQFLLLLSEKERFVIQRRFNLDEKSRSTLEEIGQHFHITRERVRQIEKNALQKLKRNVENTSLQPINDAAFQFVQEAGGLLREDLLFSKLIENASEFTLSALTLIVSLDKRFERLPNTIKYHPYVKFSTISNDLVEKVSAKSVTLLEKNKDIVSLESFHSQLKKEFAAETIITLSFLNSLFQIHKSFKLVDDKVGLLEWRHIHPRTLRDKIFFILREAKKPLHFVDITNIIIESKFDRKKVNLQAVHNELIRCEDFVLIGRGIYALKEWGYKMGTVADVIISLLKRKKMMEQDKIVEEVLKQRQVKPITVILNLKNNPHFIRIGRKQYTLNRAMEDL